MVERKTLIIPDASVIVKWVLHEPEDAEFAEAIQYDFLEGKIELMVPDHCFSEVTNILGRKDPEVALSFLSQLMMTGIRQSRMTLEVASIGLDLMKRHPKISFYDAAYHALALKEGGQFITADLRYVNQTKREGSIQKLSQYGE